MANIHQLRLQTHILSPDTFLKAIFKGQGQGQTIPWQKVSLRPVQVKGQYHLQFSYFDGKQDITKNYRPDQARAELAHLFALPFKSIQVQTTEGSLRVQMTKKGQAILHQEKPPSTQRGPDLAHDRAKIHLLGEGQPTPFLQALGLMTSEGRVRANRQRKFQQINHFLALIDQTSPLQAWLDQAETIHVIDCGCGSAHLSFAVYHYLRHLRDCPTTMVGVDLKGHLIAERRGLAQSLGWHGLTFVERAIIDYVPEMAPDIVLALHACDTATDEALAQAISWDSQFIFSVPCCHHHLQAQLTAVGGTDQGHHKPLLRHGLLKERLGDILTDACRTLILRLKGYRTDVIEFVSSDHTDKNLLLRAVKTKPPESLQLEQEYEALKATWGVTPYLENLLASKQFSDSTIQRRALNR